MVGAWWFNEPLLVDDVTTVFWRQKKNKSILMKYIFCKKRINHKLKKANRNIVFRDIRLLATKKELQFRLNFVFPY